MTSDLKLPDEAATARLGAALAAGIAPGRVLHRSGELGSGKTTLVRGLLRALGVTGPVKSPTFAWVEPYRISRLDLYHFDFYRFDKKTEWLSSGLREYFNPDAVCIVEWPERVGGLPPADLTIQLSYAAEARRAKVEAHSAEGEAWLASLRASLPSS
ncbi:MAG: tRNA (adenosine(37)-N6)-threonylcarbamoyltransferase complex ATPase subunit type 1 TsaE [Betaproteobacteria bacterium]|nr:tRNA (adenosine(37)-N6)-threonylcarbamoyltransferase complex ATPase subunit type 1 TsaE [Betaproteobacteria bacterium]